MRIERVEVRGYRSLKDVSLSNLDDISVIFGENNTGKSNILAFIQTVFQRKSNPRETLIRGEAREFDGLPPDSRPGSWMRGEIDDFSHNFYRNQTDRIDFSVGVRLSEEDVTSTLEQATSEQIHAALGSADPLDITGAISRISSNSATMAVEEIRWGTRAVYYPGKEPFPDDSDWPVEDRTAAFAGLNELLADSVVVIQSQRFLVSEEEDPAAGTEFKSGSFKNALFSLYLDPQNYPVFSEVAEWFDSSPFEYGKLSFARLQNDSQPVIEVMVEKDGLRLPIGRLGSGAHQMLVIIATLVANKSARVFELEEPEVNLSPISQTNLLGRLVRLVREKQSHVDQLIITSHSPAFENQKLAKVVHVSLIDGETRVTGEIATRAAISEQFASLQPMTDVGFDWCKNNCDLTNFMPGSTADEREAFLNSNVCARCRIIRSADAAEIPILREQYIDQFKDASP